jgi:WD40 repeat protein
VPLYAWIFQAPNGRVFMAGHEGQTLGPRRRVGSRYDGSAVMYAPNRILVMGGSKPPTATAEIIDLNGSQTWQSTDPMQHSRRFLNATILPDGKVLVTGGKGGNSYQPIYPAEMWDPATGRWATMASMQVPRLYHSTALLLPDGRVLSAGGGRSGEPDHKDAELFSPPYLFKGTRPSISSAPASVGYGQAFFVGTPDASKVATVAFIGISSVTHTFNTGQRRIAHVPTQTAGGIMVTAPASRNIAPPGHYHLFLLTAEGVPSVSKIVRIG